MNLANLQKSVVYNRPARKYSLHIHFSSLSVYEVCDLFLAMHDTLELIRRLNDRMPALLTKEGSAICLDNELSVTERRRLLSP
jgi:hypothetical protein